MTALAIQIAAFRSATEKFYAEQTDNRLRTLAAGAWTANDRETYCKAHAEARRRAAGGASLYDFYVDGWKQEFPS